MENINETEKKNLITEKELKDLEGEIILIEKDNILEPDFGKISYNQLDSSDSETSLNINNNNNDNKDIIDKENNTNLADIKNTINNELKGNENNIKEKKARKRKTDKTSDETSANNIIINQTIEDKYLELYDPVINEVNNQIMYYRKLKFQEKKFTLFTKKEDIENYNNLYYYCVNHRTTKTSKEEDNNGFKKRICICNSKIKYDKSNQKYI